MDLEALVGRDETDVVVGFFDLQGFSKWSEGKSPRDILELASALFGRTGQAINDANGRLIKAIGDAGLFVFPSDNPDLAVLALLEMKNDSDTWLIGCGYHDVMSVKIQIGPIACGRVGPPGNERLDVYGETVNHAAMMRGRPFTVSADLVDRLKSETRQKFARFDGHEFVAKH